MYLPEWRTMNDLLCDICQKEPAVYGDGVTWKRCAKCQYELTKDAPASEVAPEVSQEGTPHVMIPDLVSIIMPVYLVNYALFHYTGNAIGSVRSHSKKGTYELIVIDNGSPIKPPSLQSYYADKVIQWEKNEGVTKAWNAGVRVSSGEYIVLLNNDTQVYEGWLPDMKKCLNEGGLDLVMATPMYSNTEPFARWVEAERERSRWVGKPIGESFSDFADFSCVMFRKRLVDELGYEGKGLFDETFFNYASDVDLRKRMDVAGKRYASTRAVAIHHVIDATGASIPETPEIMNTDKELFAKKWEGGGEKMESTQKQTYDPNCTICTNHTHEYPPSIPPTSETPKQAPVVPLVRTSETGDKMFFVKDNTVHWVKSPQVLEALGGTFGMEKVVTKEEFKQFEYGEPLDMNNVGKYL